MSLVYSTDGGRFCPNCRRPVADCICKRGEQKRASGADGSVRLQRQTQGRGGKTVTLITGIDLPADELRELAKILKQRCGSGGAVKDGVIEIQGEHRELLQGELERRGYKVKIAGG